MNDKLITVITPTYNRSKYLKKLFESLKQQSSNNFKWLIIDDGSTDDTEDVIENFQLEKAVEIEYIKKSNGGKHTALNVGFTMLTTELVLIVDSDDFLVKDAIQIIEQEWKPYRNNENICGIVFLRGKNERECIGEKFPDENVTSYINMRLRKKVSGDKAEVFRSEVLMKKKFPEIVGEKFIGEDYIWCDLGKDYQMAWKNTIIYICEYLEGGLTKSGRVLRIKCPIGGMYNSAMMMTKEFPLYYRIKKGILFNCYYYFQNSNKQKYGIDSKNLFMQRLTKPLGYMLYMRWKKYLK